MMFVFILSLVGMIIERYLFFIQSKHVVGIYYGNKYKIIFLNFIFPLFCSFF